MTGPRRNTLRIAQLAGLSLPAALLLPGLAVAQERAPSAVPELNRYFHGFATTSIGESLRFNNPFRLSTPLGSTPESLSLTPPYANLGAAVFLGTPNGWQHGLSVQWSQALSGLPQNVVTPSYALLYGGLRPWLIFSRIGLPIILNPDANVGGEAAIGAAWLFTAGLGLQAEIVGDMFYGAATWETERTAIPMLSVQAGLIVDFEVLP